MDEVVLVDRDDNACGRCDKVRAHRAPGFLHRAFSVVLWAPDNRIVLQRRSARKYHFAGLWSNSCCSHPRPGESVVDAATRRVFEELGAVPSRLRAVGRFVYSARDEETGMVEQEVDHVLVGHVDGRLDPDPTEVAAVELVAVPTLADWFAADSPRFSPWFGRVMRRAVAGTARGAT